MATAVITDAQKARPFTKNEKSRNRQRSQQSACCRVCVLIQSDMQNAFSFLKKVSAFPAKFETSLPGERHIGNIPSSHQQQNWPELRLSASICTDWRHKVILSFSILIGDQRSLLDLKAPNNKDILKNHAVVLNFKKIEEKKENIFSMFPTSSKWDLLHRPCFWGPRTTDTHKTQQGEHMYMNCGLFPTVLYWNRRTT